MWNKAIYSFAKDGSQSIALKKMNIALCIWFQSFQAVGMRHSGMCAIAKENAYKDETLFYAMDHAMEKRNIG